MAETIDIEAALKSVSFLDGRTPESNTSGTFARLGTYRDGAMFAGSFSGTSPWERHPADEIVHVLGGGAVISLVAGEAVEQHNLKAGMIVIVPEGTWHRFEAPDGVTLMTVTPQPTEHTSEDVPAG